MNLRFNSLEALQEELSGRLFSECIYHEGAIICRARITELDFSEWGIEIQIENLDSYGYDMSPKPSWRVSSSWGVFMIKADRWSSSPSGWTIFFDPEHIVAVKEAAARVADKDLSTRLKTLLKYIAN